MCTANKLYWTDVSSDTINVVNTDGSDPRTLFSDSAATLYGVVVHNDVLYVADKFRSQPHIAI